MTGNTVVLTGGVGGAKLAVGLSHILAPGTLTAIVNTGDDFTHLGLHISPDIDTLLYTLSGKANASQGWGREGESWSFMASVKSLGGADWFQLGDGDLALHVLRSQALAQGRTLSGIIAGFAAAWDIPTRILPMSDDRVATFLQTDAGMMEFQEYFVARRCAPAVQTIRFEGAANAAPAPGVLDAIAAATAIIVAPSNPYLSVDPILAVPGIREALANATAPIVAVSPVIGGNAVKGPTAKLMREMRLAVSPAAIAAHYAGIIDAMLIDSQDAAEHPGLPHASANILMLTLDDKIRVARASLELASNLPKKSRT